MAYTINSMIKINKNNFEDKVLKSNILNLVNFSHPECNPCVIMHSILEKIEKKYKNKIQIAIIDLSDEDNLELSKKYQIRGIPYFIIFKKGEKLSDFSGLTNEELIESEIEYFINK